MSVDQYISSGILELYASHALPEEEMRDVESMAEKHVRIREELDTIIEGLKRYAEIYAPEHSEHLYDNILARINETSDTTAVFEPKIKPAEPGITENPKEKIVKISEERPASERSGRRIWLVAAFVLLLLSVGVNFYLYNLYNDAQSQLLTLQVENNTMAENSKTLQTNFEKAENDLKLFTDKHNKIVMMKGMPISPASEVMVFWNTSNKEVYLDVHALPAPPEGMQYQLWAIDKEGKPIDAGMLTPYKEQKTHGPQPMKKVMEAVAFAITLEKRGGNPAPSIDKMYVKGEV